MMERIRLWSARAAALAVGLSLAAPVTAVACPLCASAIENDPVAAAFNSTTIFMIVVPFVLIGSIGGWILYRYMRGTRSVDESGPAVWGPVWKEKESET